MGWAVVAALQERHGGVLEENRLNISCPCTVVAKTTASLLNCKQIWTQKIKGVILPPPVRLQLSTVSSLGYPV